MATTTSRAAIVAAARTPIGTARKGTLANMPAIELAKPVVAAVVERSGLDAAEFDDLVLAESMQGGGDSARYVAVDLGLTQCSWAGGQPPVRVEPLGDRGGRGSDRGRHEPRHSGRRHGIAVHRTDIAEAQALHHRQVPGGL